MTLARPISVSFSGIDGAGKSTQINALRQALEREGLSVRIIPFWDEIAALTRLREGAGHRLFKGEKGVGSPEKPVNRRDKNVRSWPMSMIRPGLCFLDAISTRRRVRQLRRSGADVLIFDRYIYDQFANLDLKQASMRTWVRAMMRLTPRPDVSYILDADPALARARKPEYPLDFIHLNRQAYLDLASILGGFAIISPGSVAEVQANILRHLPRIQRPPQIPGFATWETEGNSSPTLPT